MPQTLPLSTELVDFILQFKAWSPVEVRKVINFHIEWETFSVVRDEKGIAGAVRFNVVGECAHVLDLFVRPDMERRNVIKLLAARAWHKFPYVRFFKFERESKYPGRRPRAYSLAKLLKGK